MAEPQMITFVSPIVPVRWLSHTQVFERITILDVKSPDSNV